MTPSEPSLRTVLAATQDFEFRGEDSSLVSVRRQRAAKGG